MAFAVDDYDEFYDVFDDVLNEELFVIESDLICLNLWLWLKLEDGEDARGARRFRDGVEVERAEVVVFDDEDGIVEVVVWMMCVEDVMVCGVCEDGVVLMRMVLGLFARVETRRDVDVDERDF